MQPETLAKPQKRQIRFPGIIGAARQLGVHRNHLYLVLRGDRESRSLLRRYNALKKAV